LLDGWDFICSCLEECSHISLNRLRQRLEEERGLKVWHVTVWHMLRRVKMSLKKTLYASEPCRDDIVAERQAWAGLQEEELDVSRCFFVEETWIKTTMAPLYGWGRKGERLHAHAPNGDWKTMTFVGALCCDGIKAPCVIDGAMNGRCFWAYIAQMLLPHLKAGDSVIMDNLSSHKSKQVRDLIEQRGAVMLFLPAYSPDLNPIEKAFSKIKHWMRMAQKRTVEETQDKL